ncbi:MAG TPA: TrpR-like protein YerC/YecD [Clostridiales bacterium]|jgi:TrpR-related protein YerC/YecD|nr:TrpR-like protein YerC/YecD [Clostridiales bacterium]
MAYDSKMKSPAMDDLYRAILSLESIEECYRFFDDLCTIKELQAVSQRFQVARLLDVHKTYSDIEAATGASTATISRVNRCLIYGAEGYRKLLDRLKEQDSTSSK